jgi:deoxyribonuclease-4
MRGEKDIESIADEIENYAGLNRIKLIHLNDSKGDMGSRIDRHEHIGLGKIGMKGLSCFVDHQAFRDIPLILETPKKSEADDPLNLAKVRNMINEYNSSNIKNARS